MQCLILAGGLGSRIQAVSGNKPKTLIEINGRPFASYQLDWLAQSGVKRIVYSVGYQADMVRAALEGNHPRGMSIIWSDEGSNLRGTGGAVRLACERGLLEERFLVLYGDSWLPVAIQPIWNHAVSVGMDLITVYRNSNKWDRSNVLFHDGWVRLYDKHIADPEAAGMTYIEYGLSVLQRRTIVDWIPPGVVFDLATLFMQLSKVGLLRGVEVTQRFYEIGSLAGLAEVQRLLAAR